jgi:hypothetical protein
VALDADGSGYLIVGTGVNPCGLWHGGYVLYRAADGFSTFERLADDTVTSGEGPFDTPAGDLYCFSYGPNADETDPEQNLPDPPSVPVPCLIPTLDSVLIEIAFDTDATDPDPDYTDVTADAIAFNTDRGRTLEYEVCDPGSSTVQLADADGNYDNDNPDGLFYGQVTRNRRTRISAVKDGTTYRLATTYADDWSRTWPGNAAWSVTTLTGTDRFKLIAQRKNTGSTVEEGTDDRLSAILLAGGYGATHIIPSGEFELNADGYACRTVVEYAYNDTNSLDNVQDMVRAEGGCAFMRGDGIFVFQGTRFRTDNTLATVSQATFGNSGVDGEIPLVPEDVKSANDDLRSYNYVTITDCNGTEKFDDSGDITDLNPPIVLDLGNTLLKPTDAQDRVNDALLLLNDDSKRFESLTIDAYAYDAAMVQALTREISDRITVAIIPKGQARGTKRDYFIEGVSHDVTTSSWRTTFRITPAGDASVIPGE